MENNTKKTNKAEFKAKKSNQSKVNLQIVQRTAPLKGDDFEVDTKTKTQSHSDSHKKVENKKPKVKTPKKKLTREEKTKIRGEKQSKHLIRKEQKEEKKELKKARLLQKIREQKIKAIKTKYSARIIKGEIISTSELVPDLNKYIIELADVKKSYLLGANAYQVLKGISLKIKKGDFIVILGPSGSGKTTLLNVISGLDTIDSGDIFVDGYNIALLKDKHLTEFRRQKIGFVFQQYNLLPHLTAKENTEVGANLNKSKTNRLSIKEIFQMIWMEDHIHKFPYQLSGGQQQRISIARALAKQPSILFCDEPTGALDENTGRIVLDVLININKKSKTTLIIVTHNPNIAKIANAVIRIANGQVVEFYENKNRLTPKDISWS